MVVKFEVGFHSVHEDERKLTGLVQCVDVEPSVPVPYITEKSLPRPISTCHHVFSFSELGNPLQNL